MNAVAQLLHDAAQCVDYRHRRIDSGLLPAGACVAITLVRQFSTVDEITAMGIFNGWFHPTPEETKQYNAIVYWWGSPSKSTDQDNNARVMALLFASLIAEDEHA